ncbi:hypothetical protein BGZ95_000672 [Linnemannia exigua]|uniref:C2H2-type domain-containing protein n=1 Tax=Linnemannia exigua TaxID=604196 RepID=A0AAD4D800_9FUNG|nr:hypothetical protein BGZ95_000672 [Linnemannia exigua]
MSAVSSPLLQSTTKDNILVSVDALAYPSPSHSPATTYQTSMESTQPSSPSIFNRRRSSVKALLKSANPPVSPLDALVMALEATVEEEDEQQGQGRADQDAFMEDTAPVDDEEDPDATIPSSPTLFMKRPATDSSSLHHLPTMYLPESVASASAQGPRTSGLTPSTHPRGSTSSSFLSSDNSSNNAHRKMSISSQGSSSSAQSNGSGGERTKEYGCTIGNCEKKFYQVAHLRSHER